MYRTITEMDARAQVKAEVLGNDVITSRGYDAATGRLNAITSTGAGANIQDLDYHWDTVGNLDWRRDQSAGKDITETFQYDGLNRLKQQAVAGLSDRGLAAPDRAPLEEFLRQLSASKEGARSRLATSQYVLQRYKQGIYLLPSIEWTTQPEPIALRQGEVVDLPSGLGRFRLVPTAGAGIRLDRKDGLTLRWRRGGERGQPVGRSERTSLKKLLQEREVPPWWRERLPLLYLGEELLAVADLWLCHSSRLAESDDQRSVRYKPIWEREQNAADD
ncbi:MAG: tRNA lysidine(34) synthetase TilS [Pseudomonadota bacterium]